MNIRTVLCIHQWKIDTRLHGICLVSKFSLKHDHPLYRKRSTYFATALSELIRQSGSLIAGSSIICCIALSSCSSQGCHGKPDRRENLVHCFKVVDMWGLRCRPDWTRMKSLNTPLYFAQARLLTFKVLWHSFNMFRISLHHTKTRFIASVIVGPS
jgi:hypothetical protein